MGFRNFTPLFCQPMDILTPEGESCGVLIAKITLEMVPIVASSSDRHFSHELRLAETQVPIVVKDQLHGELNRSSTRWESELAPFKEGCEFIILGDAHSPGGTPLRKFQVGLKVFTPPISRPLPMPVTMGTGIPPDETDWLNCEKERAWALANPFPGQTLIQKRLEVTGERWLNRKNIISRMFWWGVKLVTLGWVHQCPWRLTGCNPFTVLPLTYEFSFGGHVRVLASDRMARRVPRRWWKPEGKAVLDVWQGQETDGVIAEAFWPHNPVGIGFRPLWLLKAERAVRIPAPRIQDPNHPFRARHAWAAIRGKSVAGQRESLSVQGMGVVGRTWTSRVALAGTWDECWAESGKPYPTDFQRKFNNQAHPDLQCPKLTGEEEVELLNLCPPEFPGVLVEEEGQIIRFQIPDLYPFLVRITGSERVEFPLVLDTVVIEPTEGRVTLLHRASYPNNPQPEGLEFRLALAREPRTTPS
jgi:hypothetical protein